jgi:predicted hotdog family 3-hydroxylacyl-ACP dehydratase
LSNEGSPKGQILDLPQSGPARLVTRVLEGPQGAVMARVPTNSPFRSGPDESASVPAILAIEMAAQAASAWESSPEDAAPEAGERRYLVGLRSIQLHTTQLNANDEFLCRIKLLTLALPLRIYSFEVADSAGVCVASGELSTFFDPGS